MKYTGYNELDSTLKNLKTKMAHICDSAILKLRQELNSNTPKIIKSISAEILGSYKMIVYQEFQLVFYKNYGRNYDVNSLNNSLRFYIDNNLHPYVDYDVSKLIITGIFKNNPRNFNQNARIEGSFGRLMEIDELDAIQEIEFEGDNFYLDNPYDWATEEAGQIEDRKVFRHKTVIHEPKQVYKEAEAQANEVFFGYFNGVLRP